VLTFKGVRVKNGFRWAVVVGAAFVLLASACGSGRSDGASGTTSDSSGAATTTGATFGALESPCGPGTPSGTPDKGVTDTSITLGYGDDAGYQPLPGLSHEMSDAMKAMIGWCNDQGGINGRQISGDYHDAAITDVNNAMTEACAKDFFLVGQGWALDSAQEQTRQGCGLPTVAGYAVSPQFANAPNKWEPVGVPADYMVTSAASQLAARFPDAVKKAGVMYSNYAANVDTKDKVVATFPQAGWSFLDCPQEYNAAGESDWKPFVQKLKDCGAEIVYWSGTPYPSMENMLTAADQLDYHPIWLADTNAYNQAFSQWNASGFADNVYFRNAAIPFEEAGDNPATQQYLDLVKANGGDVDPLGVQSTSAFLLWATAAKACGDDLTRACVAGQLANVHDWTGGGLHASSDPGANLPTDCGILMKMEGTTFVRVTPEQPGTFDCNPAYATKASGPVLDRAKLDANRISQL